ncbi:mitochondrial carrier protein [Novymonas esmeraldas]|uniref:Mitochondrial carrier protein n=1 Tax=Novymonas esmeraldas TaxID=1808958 RepID=A0AAW0EVB5_9TRYP
MAAAKSSAVAGPRPSASPSVVPRMDEREWPLLHYVQSSLITLLPGAMQGATTVVLGHPLDTAKVRMQAAGPHTARSTVGTMWSMTTTEGVRSLYRGVVPPLVMEGAKRSLQFALWDWLRSFAADTHSGGAEDAGVWSAADHLVHRGMAGIGSSTFASGAVAGGVGTLIGCPMHVIKIQTQYQTAIDTRNAWTCARGIYTREGVLGFYRGFPYNVAKDVCFAGMYLGLYAALRDHHFFFLGPSTTGDDDDDATARRVSRTTSTGAFLSGAVASMATWALLFPLDTIKTLVQARQAHAIPVLLRQPALLYRGLAASLLKAGPVSGASMAVYEQTWALMHQ